MQQNLNSFMHLLEHTSIIVIVHCSGSCDTDDSNHIGIYMGYNDDHLFKRLCGNFSTYKHVFNQQYAYITFHTNGDVNGFSRAEFTAQG